MRVIFFPFSTLSRAFHVIALTIAVVSLLVSCASGGAGNESGGAMGSAGGLAIENAGSAETLAPSLNAGSGEGPAEGASSVARTGEDSPLGDGSERSPSTARKRVRTISEEQARELAAKTEAAVGLPIVIDNRVLYWLDRMAKRSHSRRDMRAMIDRMKEHQRVIHSQLDAAGVPRGFIAIPALESEFRNRKTQHAAGLWSFMPKTARKFGLAVDKSTDERLDTARETEAAAKYLAHLHSLFGDWHLVALAYNVGEGRLKKTLQKAKHKNVFRLADEGRLKRKASREYVPRLLATLIIFENPELVAE